jgi:hypothetical protein
MLNYEHTDILGYFGHCPSMYRKSRTRIETSVHAHFEGKRIKHWVGKNSLKLYNEANVLRTETTLNDVAAIHVRRPPADDPMGKVARRPMRRSVMDLPQRAAYCQAVNERYAEALATTAETRTVRELAEPLTRRAAEPRAAEPRAAEPRAAEPRRESGPGPSNPAVRYVRGLNPLAESDAALLTAISDPKWMTHGLRNRDLVAALYPDASDTSEASEASDVSEASADLSERRRRSARVTRLLRLLRGHGLLEKIAGTHRYLIGAEARPRLQALLACRNANPEKLMANAA